MVYYRKYRPQRLEELDSAYVADKLKSVLSKESDVHAFLFTGPKGLGKTSTARIVAKIVNCEQKGIEPCNKCNQCLSITNGSNIDVLEIDGASNRGIDEIRDLREKIRLAPAKSFKKVYIIDEVHMLTTEAFNALLKTLEEPPAHAMFIFCTTEPHKVPGTIVSRCFHISFHKATEEELVSSFRRIVGGEKLKVDSDALVSIAKLSDGSFRDGAKILQELALRAEGRITKELVEKKYQISNIKYQISMLLAFLADKKTKEALVSVGELVKQGADMKFFMEQLISELHQMLLSEVGVDSREYQILNIKYQIEDIRRLIELLTKAHSELKYAVLPQLPLELVIIEFCQETQISPAQFSRSPSDTIRTRLTGQSSGAGTDNNEDQHGLVDQRSSVTKSAPIVAKVQNDDKTDLRKKLIDAVKVHNHSLAGVLRGCTIEAFDGKTLTIATSFKFHKDRLDDKKAMGILESVAKEIMGNKVNVSILLKK